MVNRALSNVATDSSVNRFAIEEETERKRNPTLLFQCMHWVALNDHHGLSVSTGDRENFVKAVRKSAIQPRESSSSQAVIYVSR